MLISPEEYLKNKNKKNDRQEQSTSGLTSPQEYLETKQVQPTDAVNSSFVEPTFMERGRLIQPIESPSPQGVLGRALQPMTTLERSSPIETDEINKPSLRQRILGYNINDFPEFTAERRRKADDMRDAPIIGNVLRGLDVVAEKTEPVAKVAAELYTPGAGLMPVQAAYRGTGALLNRLAPKLGNTTRGRVLQEAIKEGVVSAPVAAGQTLASGETDLGEVAKQGAIGGVLGVGVGGAIPLAGAVLNRATRSRKFKQELDQLVQNINEGKSVHHPPERIVQDYLTPHQRGALKRQNTYSQEYKKAVEDQYQYIKEFVDNPLGVQPGFVIRDVHGDVVDRVGRISNNPKWYQDLMRENNYRKPTIAQLKKLAEEQVQNGYTDLYGEIPPWRPSEISEIDDEIRHVREMMSEADPKTASALNEVVDRLEKAKDDLMEYVPFEGRTASLPTSQTASVPNAREIRQTGTESTPKDVQKFASDGRPTLKRIEPPKAEVESINKRTTHKNVIKRSDIIRDLSEKLDLPIRTGRFRERAHGIFNVRPEVVRSRLSNDLPTISHEIGHALDKRFKLATRAYDNELMSLGKVTSRPNYSPDAVRKEGVAEFFRLMLTEPRTAKNVAPKFYRHYMEKVPLETRKILMDAQSQITAYRGQTIYQRSLSELSIGKGKPKKLPTAEEMYTMFVEEYYPIQKRLKPMGEVGQKVFEGFRLLRGSAGKSRAFLTVGRMDDNYKVVGKAMDEILKPVKKNLDEFRTYLKDKRAIKLHERSIMTGSDLTVQERMVNVMDLERRHPEFAKAQKELLEYQDSLLNELVKGDVLDPEDVARFRKMNEDYVPFYRDFKDDVVRGGGGDQPIKRIKGSDREIVDPLESIVKNTYHYIAIAERNKATLNFVDAVRNAEGLGKLVERIPTPMKGTQFSLDELMSVLRKSGANVAEMEMEAIASIFRPNVQIAGKDNIIRVLRNGKAELYELDPMLFQAVNRANQEQLNTIMKAFALPTRILRAGVVNTFEFWFKNLFRDQFEAAIKSKTGYVPYLDLVRGMYHVMGKTELYNKFLQSGGAISFRQSLDRNYLQHDLRRVLAASVKDKTMNVITNPIAAMQALSEFSEKATRMGVFRKAVQKGESVRDAGLIARDVMDFSRKGTVGKHINMMQAFWNAQIQGIDKTIRMFTNPKTAPRAFATSMAYITTPTIGMYLAVRNDPRYKELPQWDKDMFWHFWVGDKHFRLPIPFELGVVFKVVPERLMDYALEQDKKAFDRLGETAFEAFNPIPWIEDVALLSPWIEAISNKTFTGAPIVPRREENLPPQDQIGPYTSSLAKAVANLPAVSSNYLTEETLGSPRKVDHIIRGYTGSLGQYATQLIDAGLKMAGALDKPPKAKTGVETWAFFKGFMGRTLSGNTDSVEKFYDRVNELEREYNSLRKKDEPFEDIGELQYLKKLQGVMGELSKVYREIESSKDMTPTQKRDELRIINTEINNFARMGLGKDRLEVEDFFPSILNK